MIDMGMGKHHVRNQFGAEWKGFVSKLGIFALALKHPAIQKNPILAAGQQMHGAGDFSGSAIKSDIHGSLRYVS
jgi:hypothetical protein